MKVLSPIPSPKIRKRKYDTQATRVTPEMMLHEGSESREPTYDITVSTLNIRRREVSAGGRSAQPRNQQRVLRGRQVPSEQMKMLGAWLPPS